MASETVSLCWDNFHKNMCTGMSSLLKNEDLVDVTIAVEGKYFKAHKMVLSLCSPYFRELFKVNPCKHPIVFMKDVSYSAMSDLLHFMYYGEVHVNKENVSTFRKTAEALQITGLNTNGNVGQHTVNEEKHAPPSEIDHQDSGIVQENYVSVKMEPNDDPAASSTLADDELYDPLCEENVDDFTEDYSMIEEEDTKPGTSAEISISSTRVGGSFLGEDQETMSSDCELECSQSDAKPEKVLVENMLPSRSSSVYEMSYQRFLKWCVEKKVTVYSENVLLTYFTGLAENMKSSSLWSHYSMIKSLLNIKQNIDITKYLKLRAFLRKEGKGYQAKKAKVLTKEQFNKFMFEAPDEKYLVTKIILLFGISGGCRCHELSKIKVNDIEDLGSLLLIKIPETKKGRHRSFTIVGEDFIKKYRQYANLRPADFKEQRFFLKYQNGKCYRMVIGIHKLGNAAKEVASYLNLPNFNEYTGRSLRSTSTSLLAEKGVDLTTLKRYGGLRSSAVGEEKEESGN